MWREAGIAHGPGDFSSRIAFLLRDRRGQALVEMTFAPAAPPHPS